MSILQFFLYSSVTYSNIKLALLWNGFIFYTLLFVYLTLARDIGGVWDCTKHVKPSSRLALVSLGPPVFVNLVCVCVFIVPFYISVYWPNEVRLRLRYFLAVFCSDCCLFDKFLVFILNSRSYDFFKSGIRIYLVILIVLILIWTEFQAKLNILTQFSKYKGGTKVRR